MSHLAATVDTAHVSAEPGDTEGLTQALRLVLHGMAYDTDTDSRPRQLLAALDAYQDDRYSAPVTAAEAGSAGPSPEGMPDATLPQLHDGAGFAVPHHGAAIVRATAQRGRLLAVLGTTDGQPATMEELERLGGFVYLAGETMRAERLHLARREHELTSQVELLGRQLAEREPLDSERVRLLSEEVELLRRSTAAALKVGDVHVHVVPDQSAPEAAQLFASQLAWNARLRPTATGSQPRLPLAGETIAVTLRAEDGREVRTEHTVLDDAVSPGRVVLGLSAPLAEPERPVDAEEARTDPRLLDLLSRATAEWGAMGVALTAAKLTDREGLVRRLYAEGSEQAVVVPFDGTAKGADAAVAAARDSLHARSLEQFTETTARAWSYLDREEVEGILRGLTERNVHVAEVLRDLVGKHLDDAAGSSPTAAVHVRERAATVMEGRGQLWL